jgi:hypothetical protein
MIRSAEGPFRRAHDKRTGGMRISRRINAQRRGHGVPKGEPPEAIRLKNEAYDRTVATRKADRAMAHRAWRA